MTGSAAASAGPLPKLLFALLAGTLAARLLISETYYPISLGFLGAAAGGGPTPALSVWLDWVLLAAATVALLLPGKVARGAVAAMVLLLGGVLLSTLAANDKRVALNAGAGMFAILIAGAGLARAANSHRRRQIAVAALLAGCAVNALKCVTQRTYEFRETHEFWKLEQSKLPAEQRAAAAADPMVINYERRLLSNSAFGYLSHSNVTASCLAIGALGLVWLIRRFWSQSVRPAQRSLRITLATALLALMLAGLWGTDSNGGWIALAAGLATLALVELARRLRSLRSAHLVLLLAGGYVLLAGGIAAYGAIRGTLPSESLAFRWEYWASGARAWAEHPLTGCGRENFIDDYLVHKSPAATEEVRNPHNLWLTLLYENGPLGLLGGLCCAGLALRRAAGAALQNDGTSSAEAKTRSAAEAREPRNEMGWPAAFTALIVFAWAGGSNELVLSGFSGALIWGVETGGAWLVAFALILWLIRGQSDSLAPIALGALVTALTHGLIDFALAVPSGLALLVGLLATTDEKAAIDAASPTNPGLKRPMSRLLPALSVAIATVAHMVFIVFPTQRTTSLRDSLDASLARGPAALTEIESLAARALSADPWGVDGPKSVAGTLAEWTGAPNVPPRLREQIADAALLILDEVARRTPHSVNPVRTRARLLARLAALQQRTGQAALAEKTRRDAVASFERAIAMNPTDPRLRLESADATVSPSGEAMDPLLAARAIAHLDTALHIDSLRKSDVAAKLTAAELARIAADRAALAAKPASQAAGHD